MPKQTIVDVLRSRATGQPDRHAYSFLENGEVESASITYAGLDERARTIGAALQERHAQGERALLLFQPGIEYLAAFFGCLYAGVVAVPLYPPRPNRGLQRVQSVVADAQAKYVLTSGSLLGKLAKAVQQTPDLEGIDWLAADSLEEQLAPSWQQPDLTPESLAFLQYTSGSTGTPKGVMVSHDNILADQQIIHQGMNQAETGVFVSWLPPYHDMGLIGSILYPLFGGFPGYLMPPAAFLQRPLRWLQAISKYRGTIGGSPNFGFDLCVRKSTPEERQALDLSSWEVAFNGAEPIRPETIAAFTAAFAPCGFRQTAFYPCYGLAECTLMATGGQKLEAPWLDTFAAVGPQPLVSSGTALLEERIVIAHPETLVPQPEGEVGEILLAGRHVAQGYWNRSAETEATFRAFLADSGEGPFLRTGDLGLLRDGRLFVTGRLKDVMILRGRNVYPQDVEQAAETSHPAARLTGTAAFSIEVNGQEELVVLQELEFRSKANPLEVIAAIRRAMAEAHELDCHAIRIVKGGTLPKTSSGKIQRRRCRQLFVEGQLETVENGTWTRPSETVTAANPNMVDLTIWLATRLAARLGCSPDEIDVTQPFASFGLGSLDAVNLAEDLSRHLGRELSPTLIWDYPTIDTLTAFLNPGKTPASHSIQNSVLSPQPSVLEKPSSALSEGIAIVGIGCRFPGHVTTVGDFWKMLVEGGTGISTVPSERWEVAPDAPTALRYGGFLAEVDGFDTAFFGIAPREAVRMDPQQRLLLEVAWEALEDAAIAPATLKGSKTGVFVGISQSDYSRMQFDEIDPYIGTGNALSLAANRISYWLDVRGPSLALDTACSSSLVAVHAACHSLRSGESHLALAGGVNLILTPELTEVFNQANMLAPDGRCKTFDKDANGYVRGEGVAVVVLKRLAEAQRDGNPIWAVIRGSAINQDGRSNGLTAPNGTAQQAVIRESLAQAGIPAASISYVEAHGTGTPLGDPIEFGALQQVLATERPAGATCAVASVKTNLGHLEAAAGIAGLIKTALALHHRLIPPHRNFSERNPLIHLEPGFFIPTEATPWEGETRLAGVSSFGFGGTNAHVILSEAPVPEIAKSGETTPNWLLLAAPSETALVALARRYTEFLEAQPDISLRDLCWTAWKGRNRFRHLVVFEAVDVPSLREKLQAYGSANSAAGAASLPAAGPPAGRLLRLPTYPFEHQRFWHGAQPSGRLLTPEPVAQPSVVSPEQILAADDASRLPLLLGWLQTQLARVLEVEPAEIVPQRHPVELGLDSIMAMDVLRAMQQDFGVSLYPAEVFRVESTAALAEVLRRELEKDSATVPMRLERRSPTDENWLGPQSSVLSPAFAYTAEAQRFRRACAEENETNLAEPGNPAPIVFLLSSPRAGSTLLRVMLAGHPDLFCPPELHLLPFRGMAERAQVLGESYLGEGLERALMELQRCAVSEAKAVTAQWVAENRQVADVYRDVMQLAGNRTLVDKSPSYAVEAATLRRAVRLFPNARFIHLVRHPYAVIESFIRTRMDQVLGTGAEPTHRTAEQVWVACNEHVTALAELVDAENLCLVRYEDLVAQPRKTLETMCAFLGIPFAEALLAPYSGNRMTDGLHASSLGIGDPNFLRHTEIEAGLADAWKTVTLPEPLSRRATRLAVSLGYEVVEATDLETAPLTRNQQSLWFLQLMEPETTAYNIVRALRIRADLDLDRLAKAFQLLVDRHAALRTSFPTTKGKPVQQIRWQQPVALTLIEAENWTEAEVCQRLTTLSQAPFNLERGPLFRVHLVRRSKVESILLIELHHLIADGWSLTLLLQEMGALYERLSSAQALRKLSASAVKKNRQTWDFSDFAIEQAAFPDSAAGQKAWQFWQEHLAGTLPVLQLPTSRPRPAVQTFGGDSLTFHLDANLTRTLKQFSQEQGTTLFVTLLTAYYLWLHKLSGQTEFVVGSPMAGRDREEWAETVGYFVNPVALRAAISTAGTVLEFLTQVRHIVLAALEHQAFPFALLVERLQQGRDTSRSPIFQTMFTLQRAHRLDSQAVMALALGGHQHLHLGSLDLEGFPLERHISQFDLDLMVAEVDEGLTGLLHFNTDLFEREQVAAWADMFRDLVAAMLRQPRQPVSTLNPAPVWPDCYVCSEVEQPLPNQSQETAAGKWVLVADSLTALTQAVAENLTKRGGTCLHLSRTEVETAGWSNDLRGVVCFPTDDVAAWLLSLKTIVGTGSNNLWMCTAQGPAETAAVRALGQCLTAEIPAHFAGVIEVPGEQPETLAAQVVQEILSASGEETVRFNPAGKRLVTRLEQTALPAVKQLQLNPQGVYVILGGSGALGKHIANWLARRGACHIALVSRQPERASVWTRQLPQHVQVTVHPADVADETQLNRAWAEIQTLGPVAGIFHAAGIALPEPIANLSETAVTEQLAAKVQGARKLDKLLRAFHSQSSVLSPQSLDLSPQSSVLSPQPLDLSPQSLGSSPQSSVLSPFVVYLSSVSAVLGSRNLAAYAVANGFLDGLASTQRMRGISALSINFGPWADEGMAAAEAETMRKLGIEPLPPQTMLAALERVLAVGTHGLTLARLDWNRLKPAFEAHRPRPFLSRLGASPIPPERAAAMAPLRHELEQLPNERRFGLLCEAVQKLVAEVLLLPQAGAASPKQPFQEMGFDSLMAVDLKNRLETALGITLPATIGFDFPTIETLSGHLLKQLFPVVQEAEPLPSVGLTKAEPIAIVGMSCRYPGGVDSPEAFWRLLEQGIDAITEVPPDRWKVDAFYDPKPATPGKMNTRFGGFLSGIADFDPALFGISPREALRMDPQQRILLELTWEALERAGESPDRLAGTETGVFVGVSSNDFAFLQAKMGGPEKLSSYSGTGISQSIAANRISYCFNFQGPSVVVETACSSSLVAVHLACQSLRSGESSLAIAGGVNSILTPDVTIALSQARMMSPEGRCRAFDARADGYVRSEGCGLMVLKRLSEAQRDGNRILAVIRGSAVNQDGRSNGLTAPNGAAQQAVIRKALAQAGVRPEEICYVEAHGTGTELGDPIEIQALAQVLRENRTPEQTCVVGSVKTNIGHLEAAAGIAGLHKTILAFQHDLIPAHLHLETVNPHIETGGMSVQFPTVATPWPDWTERRLAGVSSFGFGGTNAHVVLESGAESETLTETGHLVEFPWLLSANSVAALRRMAERLAAFLEQNPEIGLADVCAMLALGRAHLPHRLALPVLPRAEITVALGAFAKGEPVSSVLTGFVPPQAVAASGPANINPAETTPDAGSLAQGFVSGTFIHWEALFQQAKFRRVELPTYPFEQQRFWFDEPPAPQAQPEAPKPLRHPLLGKRVTH
ncbi:MAG: SDR family NAD(P)-dependent oxidoreductase [Blastocatellia bacterium]|nr:SDR family NAD(P)-dependent oxidoreductase [Blastocatellia bacterium]